MSIYKLRVYFSTRKFFKQVNKIHSFIGGFEKNNFVIWREFSIWLPIIYVFSKPRYINTLIDFKVKIAVMMLVDGVRGRVLLSMLPDLRTRSFKSWLMLLYLRRTIFQQ